jgi:RNA polymerase sigma-70 factor (ECF subfamily)
MWEYRAGDKSDFDRLYRATYQRIYATLVLILRDPAAAEDATQEAFLRAFKAWATWKEDAPAEAWLHRIALNVAFSHRRREQRREIRQFIWTLGRPQDADPADAGYSDLKQQLRALPFPQAAAIVLRHVHGYTNREIAFALGVPERTVASRLAAAKARLRLRLWDQIDVRMGTAVAGGVSLDE